MFICKGCKSLDFREGRAAFRLVREYSMGLRPFAAMELGVPAAPTGTTVFLWEGL